MGRIHGDGEWDGGGQEEFMGNTGWTRREGDGREGSKVLGPQVGRYKLSKLLVLQTAGATSPVFWFVLVVLVFLLQNQVCLLYTSDAADE